MHTNSCYTDFSIDFTVQILVVAQTLSHQTTSFLKQLHRFGRVINR